MSAPSVTPTSLPVLNGRMGMGAAAVALPERVLQFGEGNFLRAFVDWMLERMNKQGLFGGRAVVVQPIAGGMAAALNAQDCRYTVILRGLVNGRVEESREVVSAISRAIDPYADFDAFIACATNRDLRFVVSNTTEAGIRCDADDKLDARPAPSFPGKLTQILWARFRAFGGDPKTGLVMLPCELIEKNGVALKRAVVETAERWQLGPAFLAWIEQACVFASTLVDRIVTGYPRDEVERLEQELGHRDALMVAGEMFHAWVIEAPPAVARELPLVEAGLGVKFTDDLTPYRERKVRILNGAHTAMTVVALLDGKETVRACMEDDVIAAYVEGAIKDEILPTLSLPREELVAFAASVSERFRNPFINHRLESIALNSVSKYQARILGTVRDFVGAKGRLPPRLTLALAALCAVHGRSETLPMKMQDDPAVLAFFREAWREAGPRPSFDACLVLVRRLVARADFWGQDLVVALPGLDVAVATNLDEIVTSGIRAALARLP